MTRAEDAKKTISRETVILRALCVRDEVFEPSFETTSSQSYFVGSLRLPSDATRIGPLALVVGRVEVIEQLVLRYAPRDLNRTVGLCYKLLRMKTIGRAIV